MNMVANTEMSEERPGMIRLCRLMRERSLTVVIIPHQDRLSRKLLYRTAFERECPYYGVRYVCGDLQAPTDVGQFGR